MDGYSHGAQGLLALRDPGHDAALPARGSSPAGVDEGPGPEAAVVLAQVRWLLQDAAERVRLCAQAEGLLSSGHPLALGAELAACEASNLMPAAPVDWYGPEQLPAEALDSLLAATALRHGLAAVTRNTTDFPPDVITINPWLV